MRELLSAMCVAAVAAIPGRAQSPARPRLLDRLHVPVRYIEVFGQRTAYYEAGSVHAPTVILIPSLGWDSHVWAQNLPSLAQRYHVIAVDPLGLGLSAKPLIDYKMDTWTDGIAELMRLKGLERAAFVGAVMGGALAVQMALDHPDRVTAIVVAASNSGPGPHHGGIRLPGGYPPSLAGTRASLLDAFYDSTLVTDSVVRLRLAFRLAAGDGYTVQRHLADHRAPYSPAELERILVPALFLWCRDDKVTPQSWGADFADALPRGKLATIELCGHYPNLEQPAEFNRLVSVFLDEALNAATPAPRRP